MSRFSNRENEPLDNWNGIPVYLTTIIAALFALGFLGSAILQATRAPILQYLVFTMPGGAWTLASLITYPFIDQISFFTPFAIFVFYWWAVGIETHLGRVALGKLLLLLLILPAAVTTLFYYAFGQPGLLMGLYYITSGLLVAFATLYPNADLFSWVPFKWLAFVCLVCGSMMLLANRDWSALSALWVNAGGAYYFIRRTQDDEKEHIPILARVRGWFRRKPKLRVMPPPVPSNRPTVRPVDEEPDTEVDALLDKIAKSGLSSLTTSERAKLERARQELLKKEHH